METAILCPGPSLAGWLQKPEQLVGHDRVIVVNSVAGSVLSDWWVFGDHQAFAAVSEPVGRPQCFTQRRTVCVVQQDKYARHKWLYFEDIMRHTDCPADSEWYMSSMTAALVLAEWLMRGLPEPRKIVLYGADLEGDTYFDGRQGAQHFADRWSRERNKLDRLAAWLQAVDVVFDWKKAAA